MIKRYIRESIKYLLRSKPFIRKYINEIERMYVMTPAEIKERNEKEFLKIFRKAYDKSTFYNELYKNNGIKKEDIEKIEDIKKLPIISKDMFRNNPENLLTKSKAGLIKAHTSGTSGTPLTVYENWKSIWREQAYFYCYRKRCGFTYGQKMVSLRGNLDKKSTSLFIHLSNTLYLSSFNINENTIEKYYKKILKHSPVAIEGFPSSLYSLCLLFNDKGYKCRIPLCFTSSETMYDYQRSYIEKTLHTQIYDHYGSTERTIRLSETLDHSGYYEDPGYSINEYENDGIITTSLINDAFPLIRYKMNDLIELNEKWENSNSITSPRIKKINGRIISYIIGKDDTRYSDSALTFIFKSVPHVRMAQFVQDKKGEVNINIVPENGFNDQDKQIIIDMTEQKIGLSNMDININLIENNDIVYTSRNKLSLVVNNINK